MHFIQSFKNVLIWPLVICNYGKQTTQVDILGILTSTLILKG